MVTRGDSVMLRLIVRKIYFNIVGIVILCRVASVFWNELVRQTVLPP